jgi:hypothetical protein
MKRSLNKRFVTALGALLVCLIPAGPLSIADGGERLDGCEVEARRAYWQALKLCQLAADPNPRLRCQEAAKAIYRTTLEECRKTGGGRTVPWNDIPDAAP